MARTRIKICGITREEDAFAAVEAGADALGFVLAPNSPRTVAPERAMDIAMALPPFVTTVALFVNAKPPQLEATIAEYPFFDMIQLHGREPEPTVRACAEYGLGLVKAVRADTDAKAEIQRWNRFAELDAVLVDGGAGGEGVSFDWQAFVPVADECDHPLILAGGLDASNVGRAIETLRPWAVDVSSGVEVSPGVKDPSKLAAFCAAVRVADHALENG